MPTQLTRQEQLFGIREDEFGTLTAENERLYPFFRAVKELVDEAKIDPTDDGLHTCAVDPANVGMVEATVELDGSVPDETFGVNVEDLSGQLQNKPRDAEITIDFALPSGVLRLDEEFANGRVWDIRERVEFIDPDSIRERPDIPELEFDISIEFDVNELASILNRYPNDQAIEFAVRDGELFIGEISGSSDDETGEYDALSITEVDGDGEGSAIYSPDYFTDFLAGIKATGAESVTASWSEEFPLLLEAEGEYVSTEWFLAPRIRSD